MTRVQVYRNLNEGGYSVQSRETANYGKVIDHVDEITLVDARFVVQDAGRQRVREEGRKNVHAFVRGRKGSPAALEEGTPITYNPYAYDHFVDAQTEEPVAAAECVYLSPDGVIAQGCTYQ